MLIRTATNAVIDSLLCSAARAQLNRSFLFGANRYFIAQDSDSQIYDQYLQSQERGIKCYSGGDFKFDRVSLPRHVTNMREIQQKLQGEWKNKNILLNIDGSKLIGSRRMFVKNHLQKNVYQGLSSPNSLFSQINPSTEVSAQELKFDQNTFFCSDPVAKEAAQANKQLPPKKLDELLQDVLATAYENEPKRFGDRLKSALGVPEPYLKLIQMAVYNENHVYFCGINEYCFRNLLSKYLSLQEVRELFMMSLKFAQSQSYKYKMNQSPLLSGTSLNLEDRYHNYSRELIYFNFYGLIKKIENGQILKRINSISKFINSHQTGRSARASSRKSIDGKNQSKILFIGHQYTISTLQDHIKVNNLQQFTLNTQNQWIIQPKSMYTAAPLQKEKVTKSTENDAQRIQKHAILQVMLGDLWNLPFTFNKFPYLSENYNKLSEEDKNYVKKVYHDNVVKYTAAKRVYYKTNIRKIEELEVESAQYTNLKIEYEEKRKQYERIQQNMRKKQEQIKQNSQNRSKADRLKDHYEQYKSNYEEDPSKLESIKAQLDRERMIQKAAETLKQTKGEEEPKPEEIPRKRRTRQRRRTQSSKQEKQEN